MIAKAHFLVVYLLLAVVVLYMQLHRDLDVPMKKSFSEFPTTVSQWRMTRESSLTPDVQEVLKATDVMIRQYVNPQGERAELYIGYHNGGKDSGEIHSPKHCLPGSGWFEASSVRTRVATPAGELNLVKAVYQKGETKQLFLYWFQVRDRSLSEEYSLKLAEIANSVLYRRRDAAFIRIAIPLEGGSEQALTVGERFVNDFFPHIRGFLPS